MLDKQEYNVIKRPKHYQFDRLCAEVKDVIKDRVALLLASGYHTDMVYDYTNSIKYLLRWPDKNGLEDIKKCIECAERMAEFLENQDIKEPGENIMEMAHRYIDSEF
jgi:hypothetical protein